MDDEINSNTPCTFYEAVSTSNYSVDKNQQCEVSKLAGPPTVSTLPSILRPPKRWQKKAYYSLDSSSKQMLDDMKTINDADLLHMPTICSLSAQITETNSKYDKRANNYQNNSEYNSKSKQ
ncbi:hypothetical protein WUBG_00243 [Wuchereria bancrofti]|nr:hypothetical protein WUBG_00243 [Wuchereria bancrofti]